VIFPIEPLVSLPGAIGSPANVGRRTLGRSRHFRAAQRDNDVTMNAVEGVRGEHALDAHGASSYSSAF
jgi:hypothetical protein